jgi:hypothetical protein
MKAFLGDLFLEFGTKRVLPPCTTARCTFHRFRTAPRSNRNQFPAYRQRLTAVARQPRSSQRGPSGGEVVDTAPIEGLHLLHLRPLVLVEHPCRLHELAFRQ